MSRNQDPNADSKRFLKPPPTLPEEGPSPKLVFKAGSLTGREFNLESGTLTVGRGPTNSINVDDPGVSRSHCQFVVEGSQVRLVDLKSTNGTYVDGNRIENTVLEDGQLILIGTGVFISFCAAPKVPEKPVPQQPVAIPKRPTVNPPELMRTERMKPRRIQLANQESPGRPPGGLPNKAAWHATVAQRLKELAPAQAYQVAVCHLQGFSKIVDDNGPEAGKMVADEWHERLQAAIPKSAAGHLGGEIFAVMLSGVLPDQAQRQFEGFLVEVNSAPFQISLTSSALLTASIGLVVVSAGTQVRFEEVMKKAQAALNQARQAGGNRVHSLVMEAPVARPTTGLQDLNQMLIQKRRNSRTPCEAELVVRIQDQEHSAQLCDIGIGGLRMQVDAPLKPGEVTEIRLRKRPETAVRASVRWSHGSQFGLQFADPTEKLRDSWVSQVLRQLGRTAESARERRAHSRVNVGYPLTLTALVGTFVGKVENVSPGGCGAESSLVPPVGLEGEAKLGPLQVRAKVIWASPGRFGLQFAPLTLAQSAALHELLKSWFRPPQLSTGYIPLE